MINYYIITIGSFRSPFLYRKERGNLIYYAWLMINALIVLGSIAYIWLVRLNDSALIVTGQFFSQVAILLFIININMYFIFLVIKKSPRREIKIKLAKISRKLMKAHIPIAIMGTILILFHAAIMLVKASIVIGFFHLKMLSGYLALTLLALTLFGGYRRHKKASGFRRKFHLVMAMIFGSIFMLHLLLPLY